MKIVASCSAKNKIILSFVLFLILGSLGFGTVIVSEKLTVDAASTKVNQTVIIDAGHGGPDGGTSADDGTLEKDLNLQIAIKLNESLNSYAPTSTASSSDCVLAEKYANVAPIIVITKVATPITA